MSEAWTAYWHKALRDCLGQPHEVSTLGAWFVWNQVLRVAPDAREPNVARGEREGQTGTILTWNNDEFCLDVMVTDDARFDWFYNDNKDGSGLGTMRSFDPCLPTLFLECAKRVNRDRSGWSAAGQLTDMVKRCLRRPELFQRVTVEKTGRGVALIADEYESEAMTEMVQTRRRLEDMFKSDATLIKLRPLDVEYYYRSYERLSDSDHIEIPMAELLEAARFREEKKP